MVQILPKFPLTKRRKLTLVLTMNFSIPNHRRLREETSSEPNNILMDHIYLAPRTHCAAFSDI